MTEVEFADGTMDKADEVHQFLLDHFRVMEPITKSIEASASDVYEFFCDLRDGGLQRNSQSILAMQDGELVGISMNYVIEVDAEKESLYKAVRFDPHKDYNEEILQGPYASQKANQLVVFVETVENGLIDLLTELDEKKRQPARIFKIDVICVHPKMKGMGLGRQLMSRIFEKAVDAGCDVVAACATAQASQALFKKFGFSTIREVPFSCFRQDQEPVYRNLPDQGISGKLMTKWIR